jgi:cell division septation protein DedD
MTRKIIGGIGVLVGLGLATFFVYLVFFPQGDNRTSAPNPGELRQVAVRPMSESSPDPKIQPGSAPPQAQDPATARPTESAPATSDYVALAAKAPAAGAPVSGAPKSGDPVAASTPPALEIDKALQSPLEPTEKQGLLAGRYRTFASAKKRMEKIKAQGIPAFIRQEGKFYEVWAGPFATPEAAAQARKSLKAELKISAKPRKLIIPVPK